MKKLVSMLLAAMIMVGMIFTVSAEAEKVTVTLDGTEIIFPDTQPYIDARDRTLVPIRFVSEALGADVSWENETQTVTIVKGNDTVTYQIYSFKGELNGQTLVFDSYGILKGDRTMVPLRFISELLDCTVDWVEETNTVVIASPGEAAAFPEPKITVNYPKSESDQRLFWITLDNYRDFQRNCPNYEFKIEFISPAELNVFEQDEGAILGWQKYNRDTFKKLTLSGNTVFSVSRGYYSSRENMRLFKPTDGMNMEFKLTVVRKCSNEQREYVYSEKLRLPYSLVNVED